MKHKVYELSGALLDAAVAKAAGHDGHVLSEAGGASFRAFQPSELWEDGGPIIEREGIGINTPNANPGAPGTWWEAEAHVGGAYTEATGSTPLIAAMRAYVASKFGDEVELP